MPPKTPVSCPVPLRSARRAVRERLRVAGELGRLYTSLVGPCEVEPSTTGVLVYASTRVDAGKITRGIRNAVMEKDPAARVVPAELSGETKFAFVAEVTFDWKKI